MPPAGSFRPRRGRATFIAAAAAVAAAAACAAGGRAWVGGSGQRRGARGACGGTACQARSTAKDPWKPLVFNMPKKKPPREIRTEDDEWTAHMRLRLKEANAAQTGRGGDRSVMEDKIDKQIETELTNAQLDARATLWRMDKETDRKLSEEESPDLNVMRRRYEERLAASSGVTKAPAPVKEKERKRGYVEFAAVQDFDALLEQRRAQEMFTPKEKAEAKQAAQDAVAAAADAAVEAEERRSNIQYLSAVQARTTVEDRKYTKVVRSRELKKAEYESSKMVMNFVVTLIGVLGSAFASVAFGANEAFGFALGIAAALQYISGLQAYTDNATSPLGATLGGRRFLAPLFLVILVQAWPRLELNVESIAALHLEPSLIAALMGFFTYNIGTVTSKLFPFLLGEPKKQDSA